MYAMTRLSISIHADRPVGQMSEGPYIQRKSCAPFLVPRLLCTSPHCRHGRSPHGDTPSCACATCVRMRGRPTNVTLLIYFITKQEVEEFFLLCSASVELLVTVDHPQTTKPAGLLIGAVHVGGYLGAVESHLKTHAY